MIPAVTGSMPQGGDGAPEPYGPSVALSAASTAWQEGAGAAGAADLSAEGAGAVGGVGALASRPASGTVRPRSAASTPKGGVRASSASSAAPSGRASGRQEPLVATLLGALGTLAIPEQGVLPGLEAHLLSDPRIAVQAVSRIDVLMYRPQNAQWGIYR